MTNFSINEYKSMFLEPLRIVEPISWIKHIPFAFFIIELLKPKIVVELGVHTGNSFSAFCQAVKNLNVKASCYGIDIFKGDPHAGVYDESIYIDINNYITENYGDSAQVMRMTFNEALEYFSDGSIDLLHIDGYHTYEAVKLDFESWLPKMSDRGIILLHDTQVRRDEFGAWKLWGEISNLYPSYEFKFGYGLGVLAVGKNVPDRIIKFIDEAREKIFIERMFFTLGSNTEFRTHIQRLEGEVAEVRNTIAQKDERIREFEVSLEDRNQHIQRLEGEVAEVRNTIAQKEERVREVEANLEDRNQHIQRLEGEVAEVRNAIAQKEERVRELEASLEDSNQHIQSLEGEVADIRNAIAQKDNRVREIEMDNLRIDSELNTMKSSVTWRTVMKWHSLVEKSMPQGTRRRRWYDLGIKGLRTIANEGWRSFWWKYKQYRSSKKLSKVSIKNKRITMKKIINQILPNQIKSALRCLIYFATDTVELLLGRRDMLTPPRRMIFVGEGGFKKIGEEFLQYFIEFGSLKPNERVLDVGCGIGRMAVPLTRYLDENGSYEGFDIVEEGIKWCTKNISRRYPNFRFQLVDIFNKDYNPKGKYTAVEFTFPYENESFDFVFLTSVFTHMLPQDMENYFSEIARVLKKDGRCLITFFLLNKESLNLIEARASTLDFKYVLGEYRVIDKNTLETAVAYDEQFIHGLYDKHGLNIKEPVFYGSWCGRRDFLSYQDIIIAIRR